MSRMFADMILFNGKIATLDARNSIAQAVAVSNGRIIAVGSNSEVRATGGASTRELDLEGKLLLPGFQDTHVHVGFSPTYWYGVDLKAPPVKSIREVLEKIEQKVANTRKGEWVLGYQYINERLAERRHVRLDELDAVAPNNPVLVIKGFGHEFLVNSKALEIAGIRKDTPDPVGGKIERDAKTGEPTGVLYETAYSLVGRVIPADWPSFELIKQSMRKTIDNFLEAGMTTITEIEATREVIRAYQELLEEGRLPIRVRFFVWSELLGSLADLGIRTGFGNDRLRLMGVKFYADGSGVCGTAAVYTPQHRGPKDLGIVATPGERLTELVTRCHEAGLRVAIHAIGDRGIDIALDAIEYAQKIGLSKSLRHRIEHCSVCGPKQQERIKTLGVVPSSSIGYMWNFGDDYIENFGPERLEWLHPHRSYIDRGIVASGNSDWAASSAEPMKEIYCAVTRKTSSGQTFCQDQAISVDEGIRVYTTNAAYASCEEQMNGSIEPGKFADMVVLSEDIFSIPPEKIKDVSVQMTIVDGQIVYLKK